MTKKLIFLFGVTVDLSVPFHAPLAVKLADLGHEVHFASSQGPNLESISPKISVHTLPMQRNPHPFRDLISLLRWFYLIARIKPDVVIGGTPKASLLSMVAARTLRTPRRVYYCHGLRLESAKGLSQRVLLFFEKLTANCSTEIIAVSHSLQEELHNSKIGLQRKVTVLGSGGAVGVDFTRFHPANRRQQFQNASGTRTSVPHPLVIGFIGRINSEKGLPEFLKALLQMQSRGHNFKVLLIGEPDSSTGMQIQKKFEDSGLPISLVGHVPNPEDYLRLMDIFCLPSHREGLPTVLLEAFASGVPVVSTSVTGVVDLVVHGKTGILVPPKRPIELASALETLLKDPELRLSLTQAALEFVHSKFSPQVVIENHLEYLREV